MSSRVDHLSETSFSVADVGASRAFYQGLFGLPVALEAAGMIGLELPGRALLLLIERGRAVDVVRSPRVGFDGSGAHHLRFDVAEAALGEWERHLMLHGVAIEGRMRQDDGGMSLYFRDPDGHSLEMASSC